MPTSAATSAIGRMTAAWAISRLESIRWSFRGQVLHSDKIGSAAGLFDVAGVTTDP